MPLLAASLALPPDARAILHEAVGHAADITWLADLPDDARAATLRQADVLFAANPSRELRPDELPLLAGLRLIQLMPAGIDFIRFDDLPASVPVASNAGAYAAPMAEHALAMALAAAKRLIPEHTALTRNEFNQQTPNRMLAGLTCGIFGFGAIGAATAKLMASLGMQVHAINRRGATEAKVDWIGTPDQLDLLLAASDVLVIAAPLTRATEGMIGAAQLARMKPDAILINLARGELIDEAAFFAHLQAHPKFTACIDAWWIEPVRHGRFAMDHPFMTLPNVIGSPHNSASVPMTRDTGLRRAGANIARALKGETVQNIVGPQDRYL